MTSLTVNTHRDADGSWWADVSELPGCFAAGDTFGELTAAVGEAIVLYLDGEDEPQLRLSPPEGGWNLSAIGAGDRL